MVLDAAPRGAFSVTSSILVTLVLDINVLSYLRVAHSVDGFWHQIPETDFWMQLIFVTNHTIDKRDRLILIFITIQVSTGKN